MEKIASHFFEADRRLFRHPIQIPGYGLLKTPEFRSAVYQALYSPNDYFSLLATVVAEVYSGVAGVGLQLYVQAIRNSSQTADTPLVDKKTGLQNGPTGSYLTVCGDSGFVHRELSPGDLKAIYGKYLAVSSYFSGDTSQEIICDGEQPI